MKRMLSRIASLLGLVAGAILLISLPAQAAEPTGGFACLGNTTYSFIAAGQAQPTTLTFSQMMQLTINADGVITGGTVFYGVSGAEVCILTAAGKISSFNATTGVGTLMVSFTPSAADEDSDLACSGFFFGLKTPVAENFHFVTAKTSTEFYFMGKDDFITPPSAIKDARDFLAVTGKCEHQ